MRYFMSFGRLPHTWRLLFMTTIASLSFSCAFACYELCLPQQARLTASRLGRRCFHLQHW